MPSLQLSTTLPDFGSSPDGFEHLLLIDYVRPEFEDVRMQSAFMIWVFGSGSVQVHAAA